jgi:hypothetical protein
MSVKQDERVFYLDDANRIIDSVDGHIDGIYGITSIISKDVLKCLFERIAIAESDSTGNDKLSYIDIFYIIDEVLKSIDTYKYYLDLYKYYSRLFDIDKLCNLSETLEDFYKSTHFMDYFNKDDIPNMSKELLDRLNDNIVYHRDSYVGLDKVLKEALYHNSNRYGLQHKIMYDAIIDNKNIIEQGNLNEDEVFDLVHESYLKNN